MKRRSFLAATAATLSLPGWASAQSAEFEVTRSEQEWRDLLTDAEFEVMREEGTERRYTSPLNDVTADGTYYCKGCDQALYPSRTKYDSGTGWPSYWAAIEDAVATKPDRTLFGVYTEVHCDRCGSHLGHIFDDGPQPTGKRHCINGIAMVFRPEGGGETVVG